MMARTLSNARHAGRFGCVAIAATVFTQSARAQLTPDRVYYGVGRSVGIKVALPPGLAPEHSAAIQLLRPVTGDVVASSPVEAGDADLAKLLPMIWQAPSAKTDRGVLYAQLVAGPTKIGSPLVLQPMVEPEYCVYIDTQTQQPVYRPGRGFFSGLRVFVDQRVVMETSLGTIEFALRPDQAPNTTWNFMDLCRGGFYTGIQLHRVVALNESNRKPFVIQGGDPIFGFATGAGEGGPGYQINLEKSAMPHDFGVLSMARNPTLPNSAGSQFFICLSREGTSHLDGQFTAFGRAVSGADVIQRIAAVPVDKEHHPKDPVVITSCRLVNAPPFGEGHGPVQPSPEAPVGR